MTGLAEPEVVRDLLVTGGFLPLLGIQPAVGRWFSAADDSPKAAKTVVLAYGYWQARFGGDRSVLGRNIVVDGTPREIIGVMPAGFRFRGFKTGLVGAVAAGSEQDIYRIISITEGIRELKAGSNIGASRARTSPNESDCAAEISALSRVQRKNV